MPARAICIRCKETKQPSRSFKCNGKECYICDDCNCQCKKCRISRSRWTQIAEDFLKKEDTDRSWNQVFPDIIHNGELYNKNFVRIFNALRKSKIKIYRDGTVKEDEIGNRQKSIYKLEDLVRVRNIGERGILLLAEWLIQGGATVQISFSRQHEDEKKISYTSELRRYSIPSVRKALNKRGLRYGLKENQVIDLYKYQGGICALCERKLPLGEFCIDHDHNVGQCKKGVRGLVCSGCNTTLASIDSFLRRGVGIQKVSNYVSLPPAQEILI